MLNLEQFTAKRILFLNNFNSKNEWAQGLEENFDQVTKMAFKSYLRTINNPKAFSWAKNG